MSMISSRLPVLLQDPAGVTVPAHLPYMVLQLGCHGLREPCILSGLREKAGFTCFVFMLATPRLLGSRPGSLPIGQTDCAIEVHYCRSWRCRTWRATFANLLAAPSLFAQRPTCRPIVEAGSAIVLGRGWCGRTCFAVVLATPRLLGRGPPCDPIVEARCAIERLRSPRLDRRCWRRWL